MGKFLRDNYFQGRLSSKEYELRCIKEPENKQYRRDLIKVGEIYKCNVIIGWERIYAVDYDKNGYSCGIEVPKECFEPLPETTADDRE